MFTQPQGVKGTIQEPEEKSATEAWKGSVKELSIQVHLLGILSFTFLIPVSDYFVTQLFPQLKGTIFFSWFGCWVNWEENKEIN